jgi:hypothetical protein
MVPNVKLVVILSEEYNLHVILGRMAGSLTSIVSSDVDAMSLDAWRTAGSRTDPIASFGKVRSSKVNAGNDRLASRIRVPTIVSLKQVKQVSVDVERLTEFEKKSRLRRVAVVVERTETAE